VTEVVVVPTGEEESAGGDVAGVAFAAGMATAEAAQAGEEAAQASVVAEVAAEEAAGAVAIAGDASATAWAAREDVDQLRAEVGAGLDEIRGMIADLAIGGGPAEEEGPLTPERIEREEGPAPEGESEHQEPAAESKSAGKRYGNPWWFGGR
jgi:hypothetical protein